LPQANGADAKGSAAKQQWVLKPTPDIRTEYELGA
jgi:hypothetical protein